MAGKAFTAKISHVSLTWSPFSSESMSTIGSVTLDSIRTRISSATDATDSPSRPLAPRYASEKLRGRYVVNGGGRRYSGSPVRDWTLRGRTLLSLKVKAVSENRVTIGPISAEANQIISARNKLDHMWGVSPKDHEAMMAIIRHTLITSKSVRVERKKIA